MNYKRIYESLIDRAKNRNLEQYTETHHIIPKCMGGSDEKENLVELTPEEHYVSHQLLVKIYPDNRRLAKAAHMMATGRITNKAYGWVKRKFINAMKIDQAGSGNSHYGTMWIHNIELRENKRVLTEDDIPEGWVKGRKIKWNEPTEHHCKRCDKVFHSMNKVVAFCSTECRYSKHGRFKGREIELISNYNQTLSMNKALKAMGFKGAISHYYEWAKQVLEENKHLLIAPISQPPSKRSLTE